MSEELKIIVTLVDNVSGAAKKVGGDLFDLGNIAKGALTVGLGAAAAGTAALGAELFASVKAASEAEDVQADLAATLLSTKGASGMTLEALNALADGFQNTTRFEGETTLKGEAMLLTFTNIGKNVFPMATEAMLNMGQKFGSVDAASIQLGKALNDPIKGVTALREVGVMLTAQQEEQVKAYMKLGDVESAQKVILSELNTEFGGLAVAAGTTFAGKLDILKNKFGDIQEKIGGAMLPGLTKLGDALIKTLDNPVVVKAIDSISNWLAVALPKAIDAGASLLNSLSTGGISGVLANIQAWVQNPATQAALTAAGSMLGQGIVAGIKAVLTSGPAWSALATDIGRMMIPLGATIYTGIVIGLLGSILGKTPEEIAKGIGISIPGIGGFGIGGAAVPGFASGGVVPGAIGAPQLAIVHGGETITPAGGGMGVLTFVYSPVLSMADEREAQSRLIPVLDRWYTGAVRRRVA